MSSISEYLSIIENFSKNFQGVGYAMKNTNVVKVLENFKYVAEHKLNKTSRIFKLKKHKYKNKRKIV